MPVNVYHPSVEEEFRQLKSFAKKLYPDPENLRFSVPSELQQQELIRLRNGLRAEQFYFIVDLVHIRVVEAVGLEEMGYDSKRFTFREYLSAIPTRGMLQLVTLLGKQAFVLSERALLSFMKPQFIAHIPLARSNGEVMLTKRTISPWQFTDRGQMTSYLSEFTVLKLYESEPMNPRFTGLIPAVEAEFNSLVARLFANLPPRDNLFSPKEISLLKLYAEQPAYALNAKVIAAEAGIAVHTLHAYNKSILKKARIMFGEEMSAKTALEVASFVKKCGLLG